MKMCMRIVTIAALAAGPVQAKLAPPTPEAQAAAAAAKEKADWSAKVAAYHLCQAQNRVAERYLSKAEGAKKPAEQMPPCTDPGKFTPAAQAAPAPAPAATAPATTTTTSTATATATAAPAGAAAPAQK